jgi:branched-chain amino acid transport system permease protein
MVWVNQIVQGILLGGLYALFATGLSLVFGVMRLVNLAHGDLIVLASFLAVVLVDELGWNPITTLVLLIPLMAMLGFLLQYGLLNFTLDNELTPILATFGLAVIIQNALLEHFSADRRRLHPGAIETESIRVNAQISIGWFPLLTFAVAVVLLIGFQLLIRYTALGRSLRATSDDQRTAQLMGIDNRKLYGVAMAMAMGTAAIAGVFLGAYTSFDPSSGPARLIFAFEAVIIGGLGSLWGTLLGGIVLGVAQTVGAEISIGWGELTGHLVFLTILLVRPRGFFPRAETS